MCDAHHTRDESAPRDHPLAERHAPSARMKRGWGEIPSTPQPQGGGRASLRRPPDADKVFTGLYRRGRVAGAGPRNGPGRARALAGVPRGRDRSPGCAGSRSRISRIAPNNVRPIPSTWLVQRGWATNPRLSSWRPGWSPVVRARLRMLASHRLRGQSLRRREKEWPTSSSRFAGRRDVRVAGSGSRRAGDNDCLA
jgi:hypothetical protein